MDQVGLWKICKYFQEKVIYKRYINLGFECPIWEFCKSKREREGFVSVSENKSISVSSLL